MFIHLELLTSFQSQSRSTRRTMMPANKQPSILKSAFSQVKEDNSSYRKNDCHSEANSRSYNLTMARILVCSELVLWLVVFLWPCEMQEESSRRLRIALETALKFPDLKLLQEGNSEWICGAYLSRIVCRSMELEARNLPSRESDGLIRNRIQSKLKQLNWVWGY
jgi:hypothetical protein